MYRALTAIAVSSLLVSQGAMANQMMGGKTESKRDTRNILSDLHEANQNEIAIGKMAREKGTSKDVKSFADTLVKDHEDADRQVEDLAKSQGYSLTPASDKATEAVDEKKEARRTMEKLQSLSGKEFDQAFAKAMVQDHQADITELKDAQLRIPDGPVKEYVSKILPTLENHLQIAQRIQKNS